MEVVAGLSLKNLRPRVWDRRSPEFVPRLKAVMLSYDEFGRRPALCRGAMAGGFPAVLGPGAAGVKVYLDNGAFACLLAGREPAVEAFKGFVEAARPAWYPVPADFIPRPSDSKRRQGELFRKTVAVLEAHAGDGFCPVIHAGPWLDRYLDALRRLGLTRQLAVGGLVPHLLNSEGAQRRRTIAALRGVRRGFPGTIHAFGVGGVVTLHLAAALGFDSADSSGWRQRAARGLVVLRRARRASGGPAGIVERAIPGRGRVGRTGPLPVPGVPRPGRRRAQGARPRRIRPACRPQPLRPPGRGPADRPAPDARGLPGLVASPDSRQPDGRPGESRPGGVGMSIAAGDGPALLLMGCSRKKSPRLAPGPRLGYLRRPIVPGPQEGPPRPARLGGRRRDPDRLGAAWSHRRGPGHRHL